jgi:hypothetical protein
MAIRTLWNAGTMSEFVAGLNGDCGPTATLAALNWRSPQRWPLTPSGLRALDADEIQHGYAEANGAQNITNMDGYLSSLSVPHTTTGYGAFTVAALGSLLRATGGVEPIVVEWSNAGALPGDEVGVHFHYSECCGVDLASASSFWLDGDNRADDPSGKVRPPVLYTWDQVVAARPIACIVVHGPSGRPGGGGTMGVPQGWTDNGTQLIAPNGVAVVKGFREIVLNWPGGYDAEDWPLTPEVAVAHPDPLNPIGCNGAVQPFRKRFHIWQQCDGHAFTRWSGDVALALAQKAGNPL